jgi:5-methylcytosine-specific restriction endonuclease McrA
MPTPEYKALALMEKLAVLNNVDIENKGNGHFHIKGEVLVNYWPNSKKKSAYIAGTTQRFTNINPDQAFKMALNPNTLKTNKLRKERRKNNYKKPKQRMHKKKPFCHWCGAKLALEDSTIEHVIPLSRGGLDHPNNQALACEPCNKAHDNKIEGQQVR